MGRGSESQNAGLRQASRQSPSNAPDMQLARYVDAQISKALTPIKQQLDALAKSAVTSSDIDAALAAIRQRNISGSTTTVSTATVDNVYDSNEAAVLTSLRTKVNEMNTVLNNVLTALQGAGVTA